MNQCDECKGYSVYGTCVCDLEFPVLELPEPENAKQICHFCGVDLFLPRADFNVRMCVPCGLELKHSETTICVVCTTPLLELDPNCSVCASCRSL